MRREAQWAAAIALAGLMGLGSMDCGGKSVVADGTGGSTSSSPSSSTNGTTTTGSNDCESHEDCPDGTVCLFGLGECAPACDGFCESCTMGTVCNGCATSSCPACADCVAACVPASEGQCDADDACDPGEVCLFESQTCAPACDQNGGCADPGLTCQPCVTGSCCGCEDCVSACLPT